MADAMEAVTDIFNEIQVRQSGEDIKLKIMHKAQSGGTISRAKLGYLNVRKEFDGRQANSIDFDPERADLIRWAFEAYATGEYSIATLQTELAEQGLTTRRFGKRPRQALSHSQLAKILIDPYYTGVVTYMGELYQGRHEPLISNELFQRVQDVMAERRRRGLLDRINNHHLRGLMTCEHCHDRGARSQLVYSENRNARGVYYPYYLCRHRALGNCELTSLPLKDIEDAVARHIGTLRVGQDFIETASRELHLILDEEQRSAGAMAARVKKTIADLDAQQERLLDLAADGTLDQTKVRARLRKLQLDKNNAEEQLASVSKRLQLGSEYLGRYMALLDRPAELYREATASVRRQLIEAFFTQLYVRDDLTVSSDLQPAIAGVLELSEQFPGEHAHRTTCVAPRGRSKSKDPSLSTEASAFTAVDRPNNNSQVDCLLRTALVAGTGFEPATSGL